MTVEDLRRRLAGDYNLYPDLAANRSVRSEIVSVSSTASSEPPTEPRPRMTNFVVVSSDEEDANPSNLSEQSRKDSKQHYAGGIPYGQHDDLTPKGQIASDNKLDTPAAETRGSPIHIPSNRDLPIHPLPRSNHGELSAVNDNTYMPPAEAEKALRDLLSGSMNVDTELQIDPEDTIVEGFSDRIRLLDHQVLGRKWMKEREDISKGKHGGILADDMGLGKTIQTLTRIVEGRARKSDKEDGWAATNLVVCPLALVAQWAEEIAKVTRALIVVKHQGQARTSDPGVLMRSHVVITTYDTLKSEYEAYTSSTQEEANSKAKAKAKKRVVDSNSASSGSESQFGRSFTSKVKMKKSKKSALFGVKWYRVILDEAHNIKNPKTKGALACCHLDAKFRWCLTGTPMQNNVTELYSLIRFLRIKPLNDFETFNLQIAKPVSTGRGSGTAMKRLQVVLKSIMLRRRKDETINGKALIQLPKRNVSVVSCDFSPEERSFYRALETKMESVVEKLMANDNGNKNYISVLVLLLRLRQACNHPLLVSKDYKADVEAIEPKSTPDGSNEQVDADDLANAFSQLGVTRKCRMCTIELNSSNAGEGEWNSHCAPCVPLAKQAKQAVLERPSSSKIKMVLKLLRDTDERSNETEKTIIFSQFTSMLDLLEPFLREASVNYVRYDGSMATNQREQSLDAIRKNAKTRVILISFKAGSTGLNLTACNNVILVDMWWNPALEEQAFDRSHRFGQTRDVNIFKLKIDETVEDRILLLQEKKRLLAAAALSGDKIKNMRLGMDDLLALFRAGAKDDNDDD